MPRIYNSIPRINLRKKSKSDKFGYLHLVFRWKSNKLSYPLSQYLPGINSVPIKDWNDANYSFKIKGKDSKRNEKYSVLNKRLRNLQEHLSEFYSNNPNVNKESLRKELDFFTSKKDRPNQYGERIMPLFEFIEHLIQKEKEKAEPRDRMVKHYQTTLNLLKKFSEDHKHDLNYNSFDIRFKRVFKEWLFKQTYSVNGQNVKYRTNYLSKVFTYIKNILKLAAIEKHHDNTIYLERDFSIKKHKTKRKTKFSFSELTVIRNYDFSKNLKLDRVRDLFIVGCFSGLRISDWYKIKKDNIKELEDEKILQIITQKTGTVVNIPCLPELLDVLEKYDFNLPKLSSQKFNDYIKEVIKITLPNAQSIVLDSIAGKRKEYKEFKYKIVTSHSARRSFATNFWSMGIPPVYLIQVTGHSSESQFFEYIDEDGQKLGIEFAKLVRAKRNNSPLKAVK